MPIFLAALALLLILAVVLAHKLNHPADTLGLHAARAEITAGWRHQVLAERQRQRAARQQWKADRFLAHYSTATPGARVLTVEEAREAYGRFDVAFPRLQQMPRSAPAFQEHLDAVRDMIEPRRRVYSRVWADVLAEVARVQRERRAS